MRIRSARPIGETGHTEAELLNFIDSYWEEFWTSPSYEQVGLFLGLASKASVSRHIHYLVDTGELVMKKVPGDSRPLFRTRGFRWS